MKPALVDKKFFKFKPPPKPVTLFTELTKEKRLGIVANIFGILLLIFLSVWIYRSYMKNSHGITIIKPEEIYNNKVIDLGNLHKPENDVLIPSNLTDPPSNWSLIEL